MSKRLNPQNCQVRIPGTHDLDQRHVSELLDLLRVEIDRLQAVQEPKAR